MIPKKVILLCLPLAIAGGWAVVDATRRIAAIEAELSALEKRGRAEGESFVKTLDDRPMHAQFSTLDLRRQLARALSEAHRNRFLGFFGLALAGLGLVGGAVLSRVAAEVEEERKTVED